jgi:hypothetical protein
LQGTLFSCWDEETVTHVVVIFAAGLSTDPSFFAMIQTEVQSPRSFVPGEGTDPRFLTVHVCISRMASFVTIGPSMAYPGR